MKKKTKKSLTEKPPENFKHKKLSVFDHVNHIRQIQNPSYFKKLSSSDAKSFDHFMILRALAMDDNLVEDIASLYQYFDKIPSAAFYTLLIAIVPRSSKYSPWIKSKVMKHKPELVELVAKKFTVAKYQANEYINTLLRTEEGQGELINICKAFGLSDDEVNELFEERVYDN